jgi:hypothetical protein
MAKGKKPVTTMDTLQASLQEIESADSLPKTPRTSKITEPPAILRDLSAHAAGKKGQANALTQALTAVIIDRGGDTIPAAYFALLLSSLPQCGDQGELDVMLYLLRVLLPLLAPSILVAKFGELASLFQQSFTKYYEVSLLLVNVSFPLTDHLITDLFHFVLGVEGRYHEGYHASSKTDY